MGDIGLVLSVDEFAIEFNGELNDWLSINEFDWELNGWTIDRSLSGISGRHWWIEAQANVRRGIGNNCSGSYCHPFILETNGCFIWIGSHVRSLSSNNRFMLWCFKHESIVSDVGCVRVNWHGARNNIPPIHHLTWYYKLEHFTLVLNLQIVQHISYSPRFMEA